MKIRIFKYVYLAILGLSIVGCTTNKEDTIKKNNIDINKLTLSVDNAIKKDNLHITEVNNYLVNNYPKIMKELNNYDLRFDYKNNITTLLVCRDDIALIEDFSCDKTINNNYSNKNLPCNFYVEKPKCE